MDQDAKAHLTEMYFAAVETVMPGRCVKNILRLQDHKLLAGDREYDLPGFERVLVLGAGKGAADMARPVEDMLETRLDRGLVCVKYGHGVPLDKTEVIQAGHPVPDQNGVSAARRILDLAQDAGERDLVVIVLTGGASALIPCPRPPLTLEDKQLATQVLLESGADIAEINAVRKHLSGIKGGRLALAAYPARVLALVLSDVVGDRLDVIASGPTVPDPSTYEQCLEIIENRDLARRMPVPVMQLLLRGAAGKEPETPKPGDPAFAHVQNLIAGNNRTALEAAGDKARSLGYQAEIAAGDLTGEAREVGARIAENARKIARDMPPGAKPVCLIYGGETTVTIRGKGKGGRSQELALAACLELSGEDGVALLAAGTDGTDGPTDAAGAFASGDVLRKAKQAGTEPGLYLQDNNSYEFFSAAGELFKPGPTRTNVMDLVLVLIRSWKPRLL